MKQEFSVTRFGTSAGRLLLIPSLLLAASSPLQAGSRDQHAAPVAKDPQRQAVAQPRGNHVSSDLDALSESAEEIFDLAIAGKTDRIPKKMEALKKQASALSYIKEEGNSILLPRLGHTLSDLEMAVAAKNRIDTMRYANRITLIAATVEVPYRPPVPPELSLLDYNGRELGIWSEAKKMEKLSNIVMRMHLAWQTLMPKLIERNGTKELKKFSETMGRLEAAKTPEDYCRLSRQVAAETAAMKAVFIKTAK